MGFNSGFKGLSISQTGTKGSNQTRSLGRHESHETKEHAIHGGSDGTVVWQVDSRPYLFTYSMEQSPS